MLDIWTHNTHACMSMSEIIQLKNSTHSASWHDHSRKELLVLLTFMTLVKTFSFLFFYSNWIVLFKNFYCVTVNKYGRPKENEKWNISQWPGADGPGWEFWCQMTQVMNFVQRAMHKFKKTKHNVSVYECLQKNCPPSNTEKIQVQDIVVQTLIIRVNPLTSYQLPRYKR